MARSTLASVKTDNVVHDPERLFRRIIADKIYGHFVEKNGVYYVTAMAFNDRKFEPSVNREKLCPNGAIDAQNPLKKPDGENNGVAVLIAKEVRGVSKQLDKKQTVDVRSDTTKNIPSHAVIFGIPPFTTLNFDLLKAELEKLANAREMVIKPFQKRRS